MANPGTIHVRVKVDHLRLLTKLDRLAADIETSLLNLQGEDSLRKALRIHWFGLQQIMRYLEMEP